MKHRFAAVFATLAVVAAGAIAVPVESAPSAAAVDDRGTNGAAPVLGALPGGELPSLPDGPPRSDLSSVAPDEQKAALGSGALQTVVDAVLAGDEIPASLADTVTVDGDRIRVEVTFSDEGAARAALELAGAADLVRVTDTLFAASVPAAAIAGLDAAIGVDAVALPAFATGAPEQRIDFAPATVGANGGDVYAKTQMSQWHDWGLSGKGVSIGIVDYFDRTSWKDARAAGEVPAASGTFCRWGGVRCDVYKSRASDIHGVGVAEAIHDMAPKAKLYLATVATNEDLKKAIDYFAAKGVRILSRSLGGFYDGPGDGTGPSAKLVNYAVKKGITWFNAAGNSGAYAVSASPSTKVLVGGYFRQAWRDTNNDKWMEFAHREVDANGVPTGVVTYHDTMLIYCSPYFRLRWSDWSTSKPTDYDIYRLKANGDIVPPGYSPNTQKKKGDVPLELQNGSDNYFRCDDPRYPTDDGWIEVGIYRASAGSGSSGDILELAGNSADIYMTASSAGSAGEAFIDSKNKGMAAVGAVDPVEGPLIAGYSSQGPTNDSRVKPEISAGSNFTSRAYLAANKGGRFNGTSAATPVVAGAAAVVLERYESLTPAKLVDFLRTKQTVDRGAAGVDNVYGSGELVMKPLAIATFSATPTPKITGTRAVGYTLKATTAWTPAVRNAKYQWYRGSSPISGATKSTYKLTKSDAGKKIKFHITGSRPAFTPVEKFSSSTGVIAKVFSKKPAPKIKGTVKVGRTLTASPGTWSPKAKFSYQWKANGKSIKGATKKTYKVTSKVAGKRITVTVKATKKGYLTTSKSSSKTAKVKR